MSSERLERLTGHMNRAVADGIMVGGLGMIARNGRVVCRETYGLADREAGKPMTTDTIFRIYGSGGCRFHRGRPRYPHDLRRHHQSDRG